MAGWGKLVAGAVIGVASTVYATNEEVRKQLPKTARDLPDAVRRRFGSALAAAREASKDRRQEILRDLEAHGGDHSGQAPTRPGTVPETYPEDNPVPRSARGPLHEDRNQNRHEDDTQQIYLPNEERV